MKRLSKYAALGFLMLAALACTISFGGGLSEDEKLQTVVAQTVAAQIGDTDNGNGNGQPLPTITLEPTATKKSDPTQTPLPCNKAEFVSETIPDDTEYNPGDTFTKTWRLKNTGTCTWNTNYKVVFASGDKMNGPSTKNLTQSVAPGEQVDISVDLKAPASAGTYKGFWKIADDEDQFYVNTLWVQIKVDAPLNTYSVTLTPDVPKGGTVWGSGSVYDGQYGAGDGNNNAGVQTFVAFDVSGIPSDAIITEVKVDFTDFLVFLGDPFGDLGCLRMYKHKFLPLDAGDYTPPPVSNAIARWCSSGALNTVSVDDDVRDYIQERVDLGGTYAQVRLQFNENESDNWNDNDALVFNSMELLVKYKAP